MITVDITEAEVVDITFMSTCLTHAFNQLVQFAALRNEWLKQKKPILDGTAFFMHTLLQWTSFKMQMHMLFMTKSVAVRAWYILPSTDNR